MIFNAPLYLTGSESYNAAICELKMLFPCGVCCEQTIDLEAEQVLTRITMLIPWVEGGIVSLCTITVSHVIK